MGYKFKQDGKEYPFPAVSDLVAAAALLWAAYERNEPPDAPFVHRYFDTFTGEQLGAIQIDRYIEGSFHIWMVQGYVVYTTNAFNQQAA